MLLTQEQAESTWAIAALLANLGNATARVHIGTQDAVSIECLPTGKLLITSARGMENFSCHETFAEAYELE